MDTRADMESLPEDLRNLSPVIFLIYGADDDPEDCVLTTDEEVEEYSNSPEALEEWKALRLCQVQVFTAYKRVDQKVKPVPAVFPEDARVVRRRPQDIRILPRNSRHACLSFSLMR